jgi:N-acetylneuraminic acid mutarotase
MKHFLTAFSCCLALSFVAQGPNTWVKKTDFGGYKREQAVGFAISDKGYIATGVDTSETVMKDLWEYDATLDTWTQRADLPGSARRNAIGFEANGKGYVGLGIDNDEANLGVKLADFWEYNPLTNTWLQKADFPGEGGFGLYYATSFSANGKGFVCGGKMGASLYSKELWEYKPSIDEWAQRADFPGGVRYNLSSLAINGIAYIGLGADQNIYRNDWWKYNPGNNQWTTQNNFVGGQRGGASTFVIDGKGYVCLGTNGGLKDDLFVFDPINQSWYPRANYGGSERKQSVAFVIGNSAYVGTGSAVGGKRATMYQYNPGGFLELEEHEIKLSCYPNPSMDKVTITSDSHLISSIRIYNQEGKLILTHVENTTEFILFRNDLPAGVYIVKIGYENETLVSTTTIQLLN